MVETLLLVATFLTAPPSGEEILRRMHDRYQGRWYRSLTFVQTTTFGDGRQETWFEAASIPGKLRIDIAPVPERSTILFRGDSIYQWRQGTARPGAAFVHPLMVLGFDVYAQPLERTLGQLRGLGYDLTKVREDRWQDRAVWVLGADSGDLHTKQFWIDQERLVFVRSLEPGRRDPAVTSEIQFNKYVRLGQGWIAPEVLFFENGRRMMTEEYADIRIDVTLPPELWDAGRYGAASWMY